VSHEAAMVDWLLFYFFPIQTRLFMIIYFVSALLISAVVYKLGSYVTIFSLIFTAGKVVVVFTVLIALVMLYRHYRGSKHSIKFIGRS
jgi:hypothetical protein